MLIDTGLWVLHLCTQIIHRCSDNLFWCVQNGSQFMVIYVLLFNKYQDLVNNKRRILDEFLQKNLTISMSLFLQHSEQEYFGYSDANSICFRNLEHYLRTLILEVNNRMAVLTHWQPFSSKGFIILWSTLHLLQYIIHLFIYNANCDTPFSISVQKDIFDFSFCEDSIEISLLNLILFLNGLVIKHYWRTYSKLMMRIFCSYNSELKFAMAYSTHT